MENGKVLLCLIFNVHPIAPATVPTLVMHIVAVDRPVAGFLMAAAQASEISIFIVRCHNTCAVAFWAFHLDAGGQGAVGTICKIGFINHSAHQSYPQNLVAAQTVRSGIFLERISRRHPGYPAGPYKFHPVPRFR